MYCTYMYCRERMTGIWYCTYMYHAVQYYSTYSRIYLCLLYGKHGKVYIQVHTTEPVQYYGS
jgi:hypothetical protein